MKNEIKKPKLSTNSRTLHYYKRPEDYDDIICLNHETEYHWAMLGAYGEQYWLKGVSAQIPTDYNVWYDGCIKEKKFHTPFKWF